MQETSGLDFLIVLSAIAILAMVVLALFIYVLMRFQAKIREKNRLMALTVVETQENERKRIGADLHDHMGPLLARLKNELFSIDAIPPNTTELVDQVASGVRSASHNLYPVGFELLGLANSLEGYCASQALEGKVKVQFKKKLKERAEACSTLGSLNIYRMVTEVITNALKHSTGDTIDVLYTLNPAGLRIKVEDNGTNFNLTQFGGGMGIQNVKNRAKLLAGKIDFKRSVTGGCIFEFELNPTSKSFVYAPK